jgi:uncharacterized membrane protein
MATLLFVAIPIVAFISLYSLPERTFTVGAAEGVVEDPARFRYTFVVLVAVAGAVGSVVSILVRIRDFTEIRILNPPALFWTGLFKPIIGAAFALFVFCAFGAGLIFVNPAANEGFLVLAFAFVAGFSERFAPDLVSSLERSVRTAPTPE